MRGDDSKPLDQDVRDALEAERADVFAPEEAKARVLDRVAATLGGLSGSATRGAPERGEPGAAAPSAGTLASVRFLARPLSLAVSFGLGSIAGVLAWNATRAPPSPRIVYVDRERPAASMPPAPAAGDAIATTLAPSTRPAMLTPAPSNASPGDSLATERALLDIARSAFGRDDGEGALAALARHEKLFPNGQLTEEREALTVRALVLTQRVDQARARGARFRKRYPASVMLPAVEAALGTLP